MRASHLVVSALAAAALSAACQHKTEVPALSGPSSLSVTLNVTATPDRISQDGSAQSGIQVQAIGPDGKPLSGLPIRVDLFVERSPAGFWRLVDEKYRHRLGRHRANGLHRAAAGDDADGYDGDRARDSDRHRRSEFATRFRRISG